MRWHYKNQPTASDWQEHCDWLLLYYDFERTSSNQSETRYNSLDPRLSREEKEREREPRIEVDDTDFISAT